MQVFSLKLDLRDGAPVQERGFDGGISREGSSRLAFRTKIRKPPYNFYLWGRCYSPAAEEDLKAWLDRFSPASISSWADEVDGDFTVIVFDQNTHEAYLISDRNGCLRAYYAYERNLLCISNLRLEMARLIDSPHISSYAAYQFATMGFIVDPHSLIEGVKTTFPGQVITFRNSGGVVQSAYYSPVQFDVQYLQTESQCISELDSAYRKVFQKRLSEGRTPCVLLSGGIDSVTMLKYLKDACPDNLISVTMSYEGLYPNELEPARIAANHFGSDHHEVIIDPKSTAELLIRMLQTDATDPGYLYGLAIASFLEEKLGGEFDAFSGQDTRLHTPSFDNPREIGIYLNRHPEGARIARHLASAISQTLPLWPLNGSHKHYLLYWANNLSPRNDFRNYVLEALTPFHAPVENGHKHGEYYSRLCQEIPDCAADDDLQTVFKKYVSFEYRAQYTDDMNGLNWGLSTSRVELHVPFYDWEAVAASNRIPYHLAMRGNFTFKSWNKMPYVRKRIARALIQDSTPESILYRAKKTCPSSYVLFNSSVGVFARVLLAEWGPLLLDSLDGEVRVIVEAYFQSFLVKEKFELYKDEAVLRKVLQLCYLIVLTRVCTNPSIDLQSELHSMHDRALREWSLACRQ